MERIESGEIWWVPFQGVPVFEAKSSGTERTKGIEVVAATERSVSSELGRASGNLKRSEGVCAATLAGGGASKSARAERSAGEHVIFLFLLWPWKSLVHKWCGFGRKRCAAEKKRYLRGHQPTEAQIRQGAAGTGKA